MWLKQGKEMEFLKYISNELCCFLKANFDITIQTVNEIRRMFRS